MVAAMVHATESRRPLKTRNRAWAIRLAAALARAGASPNAISLASVVFAGIAAAALALSGGVGDGLRAALLLAAAGGVQLRLLCNLLDGMVAVEGGRRTRAGELFNDVPDRVADALIFVGAGYGLPWAAWGGALGWATALLAVATAYVRMLGAALGLVQDFCGPMAKQHRMAVMTAACLLAIGEGAVADYRGRVVGIALIIVAAGSLITIARRLVRIRRGLEAR
jgi:phosphatidylglycerophosphate synthase